MAVFHGFGKSTRTISTRISTGTTTQTTILHRYIRNSCFLYSLLIYYDCELLFFGIQKSEFAVSSCDAMVLFGQVFFFFWLFLTRSFFDDVYLFVYGRGFLCDVCWVIWNFLSFLVAELFSFSLKWLTSSPSRSMAMEARSFSFVASKIPLIMLSNDLIILILLAFCFHLHFFVS